MKRRSLSAWASGLGAYGLNRHDNRRHVDSLRHDNRVNFFDLSKQHAPGHGCKLNTRYSVRPNPNAGSRPSTIQPSSGAKPTLKLVRVVGTKYIDYFTDGTKATRMSTQT